MNDGEMSKCKKIDLIGTGETALSRRLAGHISLLGRIVLGAFCQP